MPIYILSKLPQRISKITFIATEVLETKAVLGPIFFSFWILVGNMFCCFIIFMLCLSIVYIGSLL